MTTTEPMPDFARLYESSAISPRLAGRLWYGAQLLADTYADPDFHFDLRTELPRIADRYADDEWLERFAARFRAVADRLADQTIGVEQLATCTADELVIHIIIDTLTSLDADDVLANQPWLAALPNGPGFDELEAARELCLQDNDVMMLFNPALDGIEDPVDPVQERQGAANLHPRDWFSPFDV